MYADKTPEMALTEPMDRSIPLEMMTIVIPTAIMPKIDSWFSIRMMVEIEAKPGWFWYLPMASNTRNSTINVVVSGTQERAKIVFSEYLSHILFYVSCG